MAKFLKVIAKLAGLVWKYGKKYLNWAWANKAKILEWISWGFTVDEIVRIILNLF